MNEGIDTGVCQNQVEVRAYVTLAAGQKKRHIFQIFGKFSRRQFHLPAAYQKPRHFAEEMVEDILILIRAYRDVGKNQINLVFL